MNLDHKPTKILITGPSGSGKTTLAEKVIRAWKAAPKFIFDPDREFSRRLNVPAVTDPAGIERAAVAPPQIICYDPAPMFPGDFALGFRCFTRAAYELSRRRNGPKLIVLDELQKYAGTATATCPNALCLILDSGRREELDMLLITHSPALVHPRARDQLTETCAFRFESRRSLEWLEAEGFNPETIRTLPRFAYAHKKNGAVSIVRQ